ncbi:RNA polymerase sigma-70 factor [Streptomyces roseolilacinus]|uniref:RNA polymerase sigma24 factor n=1 Tax=Streptomyces roseolilacinus TaxID=66904 RepID=A0A918B5T8_9ACTN|nr:RNA polymerase sigma-70 factor [Streptomyces roseolilacinus]GGQ32128.1 RNA polymerase sigma24 factor [Streptomyces roseolilacinus]
MSVVTESVEEFESHRPRMFGLAYRMLGSASEAEDVVQDAYLRWSGTGREGIDRPGAWLAKVVTNLCLNRLTSARARREQYPGPWLPEPVVTDDGALGPLESAERREAVSTALLVLLERLTPTERAVYVLREAFAYSHREIAGVLDVSEANSRQLHRRAAARVAAAETRFTGQDERRHRELVESFVAAARDGDLASLEKTLAADVVWWGDGGGVVSAARRPIEGREKVLRFLSGLMPRYADELRLASAEINGAPALVAWSGSTLVTVVSFVVRDGAVAAVHNVVNPVKLAFAARQLSHPGGAAGS